LDDWRKLRETADQTTKDLSADLKVINDYWEEYSKIQRDSITNTGRQYFEMQNLEKAIKGLGEPIRDVSKLMPGLSPSQQQIAGWLAWREATDRAIKDVEQKARAGVATFDEVWHTGIQKLTDEWGTWQTQGIRAIQDVGNALASDISSGLGDILNGTKSVSAGF